MTARDAFEDADTDGVEVVAEMDSELPQAPGKTLLADDPAADERVPVDDEPATDDEAEVPASMFGGETVDQSTEAAELLPTEQTFANATNRSTDARLARLHLRGGLLTLARAELEQMAGAGTLDREALADLAEARWRSGDLEGAAEAAQAHLANGGSEPMAHLIVAEALDRHGHLIDARSHSAKVVERLGIGVDRLFAGESRSTAWPAADGAQMFTDANDLGRRGLLVDGTGTWDPEAANWLAAPPPEPLPDRPMTRSTAPARFARTGAEAWARPTAPASERTPGLGVPVGPGASMRELLDAGRAAGLELEEVERQVELGDLDGVADRLALLLRMDRALAPVILSLADRVVTASSGDDARLVSLHMLRGDIYRGLGRDVEATAAYQEAMRAVSVRANLKEPT